MTAELIEKFIDNKLNQDKQIEIHLKKRSAIRGLFIKGKDYEELKTKNFWRIVQEARIEEWKKTKDLNIAKLFSGTEISRLSK